MFYFQRETAWGDILVAINMDSKIAGIWFKGQKYFPDIKENAFFIESLSQEEILLSHGITQDHLKDIYKLIHRFDMQIQEYEKGNRKEFDLPLGPVGSEFRQQVWNELVKIPYGRTISYGSLGQKIAKLRGVQSMSAQAIGGAVGHNPISLIIPCHRVVGANGDLTGYAGGFKKKEAILQHEGIKIINAKVVSDDRS